MNRLTAISGAADVFELLPFDHEKSDDDSDDEVDFLLGRWNINSSIMRKSQPSPFSSAANRDSEKEYTETAENKEMENTMSPSAKNVSRSPDFKLCSNLSCCSF